MTTHAEDVLLERIENFDKTPREIIMEGAGTVIQYGPGGWLIGRMLLTGDRVKVEPDQIPVNATPDELRDVVNRISPPPAALEHTEATRQLDRKELVEAINDALKGSGDAGDALAIRSTSLAQSIAESFDSGTNERRNWQETTQALVAMKTRIDILRNDLTRLLNNLPTA